MIIFRKAMFDINDIEEKRYISLETYKRNNQPVRTPVWFVMKNNLIYVVTRSETGKVKRLRNNLQVKIAPCTMRGKVTGQWVLGTAKILSEEQTRDVISWRDKKYGFLAKMAKLLSQSKGEFYAFSISIN